MCCILFKTNNVVSFYTNGEKWISKNAELIGEKILILTIKDWLILALDESVPNADRWYLASSVLIGLALNSSKIARDECFNLFSSMKTKLR